MPTHFRALVLGLSVAFSLAVVLLAEPPKELPQTATVDELERAARRQTVRLTDLLAKEEKFADNLTRDKISLTSASIVCLAQSLQDHPEGATTKISAADLQVAATAVLESESHADAKTGLAGIESALAGEKKGAEVKTPWNELVPMEPMMEGFNEINNNLRTTVRRSRNPDEDALDATIGALLSLAMKADTSYVDETQVADWQMMSDQMYAEYMGVAKAIKSKDTAAAQAHHKNIVKLCADCHDKYRSE